MGRTTKKKRENSFQSDFIKELKNAFDGCIILKNDSSYLPGVPDLLVLHNDQWATLEVKREANAHKQPNQEYYVDKMNDMSFSRFVYPENKDEVLDELKHYFNR